MRMWQCYLRIALRARSASGLLDALGLGYDLPVGQAVYAIDAFPDDDLLWRIEWIGGVGYNTSVPSEPQIDVCLAQLPKGEKNPLSARARSSQVEKRTVKIGVGLLPYVWIGSVWQKRRPVITNLSAYRGRVSLMPRHFGWWLCVWESSISLPLFAKPPPVPTQGPVSRRKRYGTHDPVLLR